MKAWVQTMNAIQQTREALDAASNKRERLRVLYLDFMHNYRRDALASFAFVHGCSVHRADRILTLGEVLHQRGPTL
jgi:GH24 family phage-related lysozyme (muramidase)